MEQIAAVPKSTVSQPIPVPPPMILKKPVVPPPLPQKEPVPQPEPVQQQLPIEPEEAFTIIGELFNSYILVEQGSTVYMIDKHAAHERILFDKLKAHPEEISSQSLLLPVTCQLGEEAEAVLLSEAALLDELGYEVSEFGQGVLAVRRIPMDLSAEQAAETLALLASDLLHGRREDRSVLRDNMLHTIACKAAIKAGWRTDPVEREALVRQVLSNYELKYCPHGRPVCIQLTKSHLDRQFKR